MNTQLLTDLQSKEQKFSKRKAKRGKRHKRRQNRQSKPQSMGYGDNHHADNLQSLHNFNAYPLNSHLAGGLDDV